MSPTVSTDTFNTFFAWAPLVIGIVIYGIFYFAKRRECAPVSPVPTSGETYSCAQCGRRGPRDQMVAQHHGGAVSYACSDCAKH
ncbi:MAG TPA: hypothetical protein VGX91_03170 [Candidatus Cybelea sp.]|jgi:DNA-directed RNA polymerase subunit RPC12/RpoP|nr:hypothetical protein [Candidatus Cybelea sp.]